MSEQDDLASEEAAPTESLPEPQPAPRRRPGALVAIWTGVALLLAGGVFGVLYLTASDEGSPEDAARRLFQAVADEDVLGAVEAFAPSERDAVADNLPAIAEELERLEILSRDFDLRDVRGVDLSFQDLRFTSEDVGDEVSLVRLAGGRVSYRVEPRQLPFGDFIRDITGEELPEEPATGSDDVVSPDDAGSGDDFMVAIKEDGRWYMSVAYTVAEQARRESGAPVPQFGEGVEPDGEDSPEAAVEALVRAGLALDVERAIALVDPEEGRALQDYAPLFVDDAKQAAADVDFTGTLRSIDLDAERTGDGRASVAVRGIAVDFEVGGENGSVAFEGECVTVTGPGVPPGEGRICADDTEAGIPAPISELTTRLPETGIVTVERDGDWYVAPMRTLMESLVAALQAIEPQDLEDLGDLFSGFAEDAEAFDDLGVDPGIDDGDLESPEAFEGLPDLDDDGMIGDVPVDDFADLSPAEQGRAYQRELEEFTDRE